MPGPETVLHVGCGSRHLKREIALFQEWTEVRLDISPDVKPDVIGSITDMSMVKSASVEAVFSSHNIEHVFPHEVPLALAEFRRVLKPGGFVFLLCPDLQGVGEALTEGSLLKVLYDAPSGPITPMDMIYGHTRHLAHGRHYMAHRSGFTQSLMNAALQQAAFERIHVLRTEGGFELLSIAFKTPAPDVSIRHLIQKLRSRGDGV